MSTRENIRLIARTPLHISRMATKFKKYIYIYIKISRVTCEGCQTGTNQSENIFFMIVGVK